MLRGRQPLAWVHLQTPLIDNRKEKEGNRGPEIGASTSELSTAYMRPVSVCSNIHHVPELTAAVPCLHKARQALASSYIPASCQLINFCITVPPISSRTAVKMSTNQPTFLGLPVELRLEIFSSLQHRSDGWETQLTESLSVIESGIKGPNLIALSKACQQLRQEILDYYCSNKTMVVYILKPLEPWKPLNPLECSRLCFECFTGLTNVRSMQVNAKVNIEDNRNVEIAFLEALFADMAMSTTLEKARINVELQASKKLIDAATMTKSNVEVCKLRMQASREGKQSNKSVKDIEIDFGVRAVKFIKSWHVGPEGSNDIEPC